MSEPTRGALRLGFAVCLTALVVGPLHVPQPFLALLATQLLIGIPCHSAGVFFSRLASAAAGSLGGLAILTFAPNSPWLSIPLFFAAAGWGTAFVARRRDPASAILFAMGIASMFAEGFVYPERDLPFGLAHMAALLTAAVCSPIAGWFFPLTEKPKSSPHELSAPAIGTAAVASLVLASAILPTEFTVTVVAAVTTALSLGGGLGLIGPKFLGGLLGAAAAVVFVIIASSMGNDMATYLLGLAVCLGLIEWGAGRFPTHAAAFRQAGAIFAVMGTILPEPERHMWGSLERMCAVIAGLATGCAAAWFTRLRLFSEIPQPSKDNSPAA
jgi:hypothetical protein